MPGYDKPLLILPFDHRSSFSKKLFGFQGTLTKKQIKEISDAKEIIYEAFLSVYENATDQGALGILVDERFGSEILRDAGAKNIITSLPTEKSGQTVFTFEYGEEFKGHIDAFSPRFVKALVRYHPDHQQDNAIQIERLKELSDFCHEAGYKFMFELLLVSGGELIDVGSSDQADLVIESIKQLQEGGVEPDVWKVEGYDEVSDWNRVTAQMQSGDARQNVKAIVLGRGENADKVSDWLRTARQCENVIGFAIGRTIFFESLRKYLSKELTQEEAKTQIAKNFSRFISEWNNG